MSGTMALRAQNSNPVSAGAGIRNTQTGDIQQSIISTLRKLFPTKTWASLSMLTHTSERVAKHRLAGTRDFSANDVAMLLRSEVGFEFLCALMAEAQPRWWRGAKAVQAMVNSRRAVERERNIMQEAANEFSDLNASIARAETILALQDQDFHRPQLDALGSISGRLRGAVAR